MKIGIEYEGVLLNSRGTPTKWSSLSYEVRNEITKKYFGEYPCDGCDYLIEVRTTPHINSELLLNEFYFKKNLIESLLRKHGLKVAWTELKIPKRNIDDDKKNSKTQFVFDEKGRHFFEIKDNVYRGGGLHINFDSYNRDKLDDLFKMYYKVKYTDKLVDFKSQYRNKLLFRMHNFGFELMSVGFSFQGKRDKRFDELIRKAFSY